MDSFKIKYSQNPWLWTGKKNNKKYFQRLSEAGNSNLTHLPYIVTNIFTEGQFKIADFPYVFNYGLIDGKPEETLMIDLSFKKKAKCKATQRKKGKRREKRDFY
jgi:hypothetical protein